MEFRKRHKSEIWHWEEDCPYWPTSGYVLNKTQPRYAKKCRLCTERMLKTARSENPEIREPVSNNEDLPSRVAGHAAGQIVCEVVEWFASFFS